MTTTGSRQDIGAQGEELAAEQLRREGLQIIDRNWRCKLGEIDIIATERVEDKTILVFCEVKCRTGLGYGSPLEAITKDKLRRLRHLAAQWLVSEGGHADDIRIDAVGVVLIPGEKPVITHARAIG